jgi:2-isopropylmalate synthase
MIKILDTTLREGKQTANVSFTAAQHVKIAKFLDDFGVDIIEVGHPVVSAHERECIKAVTRLSLRSRTLAHARARREDIDAALRCGTDWVGIFAGINKFSLKYRYRHEKTRDGVLNMISESVSYAKDRGLSVKLSIEDATRTPIEDIMEVAQLAEASGADVLGITDTVGTMTPERFYDLIKMIGESVRIDLEAHCHNDFGLALANSLAAYRAGIKIVDVSINGLGERAGITSLAELCTSLKLLYEVKKTWQMDKLQEMSTEVAAISGVSMDRLRPIVGMNAFTHTADLHVKTVEREPKAYEAIKPESLGRKRRSVSKREH